MFHCSIESHKKQSAHTKIAIWNINRIHLEVDSVGGFKLQSSCIGGD